MYFSIVFLPVSLFSKDFIRVRDEFLFRVIVIAEKCIFSLSTSAQSEHIIFEKIRLQCLGSNTFTVYERMFTWKIIFNILLKVIRTILLERNFQLSVRRCQAVLSKLIFLSRDIASLFISSTVYTYVICFLGPKQQSDITRLLKSMFRFCSL